MIDLNAVWRGFLLLLLVALAILLGYVVGDRPDAELRSECRAMAAQTHAVILHAREVVRQGQYVAGWASPVAATEKPRF